MNWPEDFYLKSLCSFFNWDINVLDIDPIEIFLDSMELF